MNAPTNRAEILGLIAKLSGQKNILTIPRLFIDYAGSLDAGLLLSQILFRSDQKMEEAEGWFYKTYAQWKEELGLGEYEVRKATRKLVSIGAIETSVHPRSDKNPSPTLHYRIGPNFLGSILHFLQDRPFSNSSIDPVESEGSYNTEKTTETTAGEGGATSSPTPLSRNPRVEEAERRIADTPTGYAYEGVAEGAKNPATLRNPLPEAKPLLQGEIEPSVANPAQRREFMRRLVHDGARAVLKVDRLAETHRGWLDRWFQKYYKPTLTREMVEFAAEEAGFSTEGTEASKKTSPGKYYVRILERCIEQGRIHDPVDTTPEVEEAEKAPPRGYSWEKDSRGKWKPFSLGADGRFPWGAETLRESQRLDRIEEGKRIAAARQYRAAEDRM